MDKKKIIANSKEVFKHHKGVNTLIATTDGNYFLEEAKNMAADHARRVGGKTFKIERSETESGSNKGGEKAIEAMTKAELVAFAESKEITLSEGNKSEMLAELTEKLSKEV